MSSLPTFERADTLEHALQRLTEAGPPWTLLAGGTDIMVWMKEGQFKPDRVLDLWGIRKECNAIEDRGDVLSVGALATYSEIIASPLAQEHLPVLVEASKEVGAVQIQNRGTIGGNIGGSSPAGDTLPVLLAYDASVVLRSARGTRSVPYRQYCTGYRTTARKDDEIIVEILFPKPSSAATQRWYKAGTRLALAISKVMVAAVGETDDDGRVTSLAIGVGSVAPVPVLLDSVTVELQGKVLDERLVELARKKAERDITPIDDIRSTAQYRRSVTGNLVARFLSELRG